MSAAQTIDPAEESSPLTNNSVPTDIEGDPITFDGNPAHAEGVCQETIDCNTTSFDGRVGGIKIARHVRVVAYPVPLSAAPHSDLASTLPGSSEPLSA